ncbi:MAG: 30S ribosomal protein S16 [Armatimonadota bacterium]|nr:30S ribosomal protein S16 [Armatimonadota bacterium]MDR7533927.1 30S ribosomal protein S16 [Armatimonadota bacterium]MDR7536059.1 30S ribosomal protein S16 [Armatimonadota bacterium]
MAVKIRLMRMGAKHQPVYRVVVADSRTPRGGKYLEALGYYNPRTEPSTIRLDEDRVRRWLDRGARPSQAARVLLEKTGILRRWEAGRSQPA